MAATRQLGLSGRNQRPMQTVPMHKPASPLAQLRGGLEGPPPSSLVRLHDLAAWLNAELPMRDLARAEATVRAHLAEHAACAVYWLPPGHAPQLLPPAGPVPVEPGRRVLSRGLGGGAVPQPVQAAAIGPGNPPQRAWALTALELATMAVNRAEACALFGYPLAVEAAPAAAAAVLEPEQPTEWTDKRLKERRAELQQQGKRAPMQQLEVESGIPRRTIQHRLQQLDKAERDARVMAGMGSQLVKAGKRRS
jgi:hypothetical protein